MIYLSCAWAPCLEGKLQMLQGAESASNGRLVGLGGLRDGRQLPQVVKLAAKVWSAVRHEWGLGGRLKYMTSSMVRAPVAQNALSWV